MGPGEMPVRPNVIRRQGRGHKTALHNSGFGTVFAVADDRPLPVCDYAGFARVRDPVGVHATTVQHPASTGRRRGSRAVLQR